MLPQLNNKLAFVAILGLATASTFQAFAVPTIRVWDGVNAPVLVADESPGDGSGGALGVVTIGGLPYNG